jgi:hypothetical protein
MRGDMKIYEEAIRDGDPRYSQRRAANCFMERLHDYLNEIYGYPTWNSLHHETEVALTLAA